MPKKYIHILAIAASLLFILVNSIFIAGEFYYLALVPFILAALYLLVFKFDVYFLVLVFFTPLSVQLSRFYPGLEMNLSLPTEPMIFLAMLVFFAKVISGREYHQKIFFHPVSLLLILSLAWMLLTSITSSIPFVSFKYFTVRLWFVTVFFFLAVYIFRDFKMVKSFLWLYIIPFTAVILYTLIRHSEFGFFHQKAAHWVVRPFYNDHTSYGAALAMFIPVIIAFITFPKNNQRIRLVALILLGLFLVATLFSYTRATWLSLFITSFIWLIILLKIRFRTVAFFTILVAFIAWNLKDEVLNRLEKTTQESSSNFAEHVKSITNIRTDASNLERFNRWNSAVEMIKEKPFMGWGPGTYMFKYAPFQKSYDRTIISTNFGEGGNVHSEYLGPIVASGFPGVIFFLAFVVWVFYTGIKVYRNSENKSIRRLSLGLLMGLTTYLVHGVLNNFLDTDKAAVPFFGFIAILVAFDLYYLPANKNQIKNKKDFVPDITEVSTEIK